MTDRLCPSRSDGHATVNVGGLITLHEYGWKRMAHRVRSVHAGADTHTHTGCAHPFVPVACWSAMEEHHESPASNVQTPDGRRHSCRGLPFDGDRDRLATDRNDVSLRAATGHSDGLVQLPGGDSRHMMLLTLMRPHLYEIYLDAERRRNGVP